MVSGGPRLTRVLEDYTGPSFDLYFIYPSDLKRSKRIGAFRDFLTGQVEAFRSSPLRQ